MTPLLSVENLALVRGERALAAGLRFSAAPGDVIEITGPNGAGKTSLLRALAGFLRPAEGAVAPADRAERLHYLGHRDGLKPSLSVAAHARFWADLYGGNRAAVADALSRVGLAAFADLPARVLSQGQARRLALTRLLTAQRPIWLLDEPAAALDAAGKALVRDLIVAHAAAGGTAIAAVHETLGVAQARTLAL